MQRRMIASYNNTFGNCEVNRRQSVKMPQRVRLVRDGVLIGETCPNCSGYELKNRKVQVRLMSDFAHMKGCKYAR